MTLTCDRCNQLFVRPYTLGGIPSVIFVCRYCRCTDCQIIFDVECSCGFIHGQRSIADPAVCTDCIGIRLRVMYLEEWQLKERLSEFIGEDRFCDGTDTSKSAENSC